MCAGEGFLCTQRERGAGGGSMCSQLSQPSAVVWERLETIGLSDGLCIWLSSGGKGIQGGREEGKARQEGREGEGSAGDCLLAAPCATVCDVYPCEDLWEYLYYYFSSFHFLVSQCALGTDRYCNVFWCTVNVGYISVLACLL